MTNLEHALEYAALGLRVLPLYHVNAAGQCSCGDPSCKSPGKHPRTRTGVKAASTNTDTINLWWRTDPEANIGIATGEKSGCLVVDIDVKSGGFDSLSELSVQYGYLNIGSWEAETGSGGEHFYFKYPGETVRNAVSIAPGIDIRGDEGYVVAPPSNHISGRTYSWINEPALNDLQPLPPEWEQMLRTKGVIGERSTENGDYDPGLGPLPDKITPGTRNATLFQYGSLYRRYGNTEEEIYEILKTINKTRCGNDPLDDKEIRTIAKSASKYERGELPQSAPLQSTEPTKQVYMKGDELMDKELPPQVWVWGDRLAVGLSLLAGAPKVGKSWMALALGMAVARGEDYLGKPTEQGSVLYYALEDTERRLRDRALTIDQRGLPPDFYYQTEAMPISEGLPKVIEMFWIKTVANPRLVIIDTLGHVRSTSNRGESAYQYDVRDMKALKEVADRNNLCILLIHHKRKESASGDDDIFEKINGTQGIFGAMDTVMLLDGKRTDAHLTDCKLAMTGRDVDADTISMFFENGVWSTKGAVPAPETAVINAILEWRDDVGTIDWQGTKNDLRVQLISYGLDIDMRASVLSVLLAKARFTLKTRYGIVADQMSRTTKTVRWRITQQARAQCFDEIPTPDEIPPEFLENNT